MDSNVTIPYKASMLAVQQRMNDTFWDTSYGQGDWRWYGQDLRWRDFLKARNSFVQEELSKRGYTPSQYKHLSEEMRRSIRTTLEHVFRESFFAYTRDADWMEHAVGPRDDWIALRGMSGWQVLKALQHLIRCDVEDPGSRRRQRRSVGGGLVPEASSTSQNGDDPAVMTNLDRQHMSRLYDPVHEAAKILKEQQESDTTTGRDRVFSYTLAGK